MGKCGYYSFPLASANRGWLSVCPGHLLIYSPLLFQVNRIFRWKWAVRNDFISKARLPMWLSLSQWSIFGISSDSLWNSSSRDGSFIILPLARRKFLVQCREYHTVSDIVKFLPIASWNVDVIFGIQSWTVKCEPSVWEGIDEYLGLYFYKLKKN